MGIEYKIKCVVPYDYDPSHLSKKLPSPVERPATTEIYKYAIQPDGFYFVDYLVDVKVASLALRQLIDEALRLSDTIAISEA